MTKLRKLKRDKVVSVVNGKDLVGVYFEDTNGAEVLLECSPQKADLIIAVWNRDNIEFLMSDLLNVTYQLESAKKYVDRIKVELGLENLLR